MWITEPSSTAVKTKWKLLPDAAAPTEAFIAPSDAINEAVWCGGVNIPVSFTSEATMAYIAIAIEAIAPAPAP